MPPKKQKPLESFGLIFALKNWHYSTWLVHYLTLKQFARIFKEHAHKEGIVLDIGCSTKPYEALITHFCSRYFGLEHLSTLHTNHSANFIGTAYHTGLKNESVHTVFAGAVLEHLEEPSLAIKEMHRILKTDGIVIISAPLFWQIHEAPRDYFRYTKYGFEHLLQSNGFEIVEIKALSGFWVNFVEMFLNYIAPLNRGILKFFPIIPIILVTGQAIALLLHKLGDKSEIWSWASIAVGRKKQRPFSGEPS